MGEESRVLVSMPPLNTTVISKIPHALAQAGQFELNVMTRLSCNIPEFLVLLTNYRPVFREHCVLGIKANEENWWS